MSETHSKYIANKKNHLVNPHVKQKVILPHVKMLKERLLFWNMKCP